VKDKVKKKSLGGSGCDVILSENFLGSTEENQENFSQHCQCYGQ
jgi:hypothetical protein